MRVKRPVRRNLALEPELFGIGRKQQLDRGGVEADAMVQPLDPVFRIDALDGHHGGQDLRFRDAGRIASEQRLDVERLWRHDHEIDAVARNVHPRQLVHHLVDLCDDDAFLKAVASMTEGESSVFGPMYRLPARSALRATVKAT
jgi:hypothetical protein